MLHQVLRRSHEIGRAALAGLERGAAPCERLAPLRVQLDNSHSARRDGCRPARRERFFIGLHNRLVRKLVDSSTHGGAHGRQAAARAPHTIGVQP